MREAIVINLLQPISMNQPQSPFLELRNVTTGYGSVEVLHDINLSIHPGEIVSLIGANGAGKTTLLMTISGQPRARHGAVFHRGEDITQIPMHHLIRRGIAHVPEGRHIFPRLTVYENLMMGAEFAEPQYFEQDLQKMYDLFPILKSRKDQRGGTLSGGEQQMLAIARGLMARPSLLMLDEPSLGLAPLVVKKIFQVIAEVNQQLGITVLLIEQNAFQALKLAHRGFVLVNGRITLSGTGAELLANPEVRAAYLEGGH